MVKKYGQQPTYDLYPDNLTDGGLIDLSSQSPTSASLYGNISGIEQASQQASNATDTPAPADYSGVALEAGKGAAKSMNAGGGIGQTVSGAGLSVGLASLGATSPALVAAGPYGWAALAAGLAISEMEGSAKADAQHERDVIKEATDRKLAVQNALTQQLGAARMFGV
jgi:hypothetical protein